MHKINMIFFVSCFLAVSHFTVAFFGRQYCFVVAQYYFLNTFTALQTCILFLLVLLCPLVVAAQLTSVVPNVSRNVTTLSRNIITLPRTKFKLVSKMPVIIFCAMSQLLSVVECTSAGSASGGVTAFETLAPSFDPLMMVNITAAFENEKEQAIVHNNRRITTHKKRNVRQFSRHLESFEDIMAHANGRRRLTVCGTWKFADDASLSGSDGWNVLSASCNLGSAPADGFNVPSGKTLKIKKDPTMVGELVIDRQATSSNKGQHFMVQGTLNIEGVTLTGGYVSAIDKCN
jgi:hypothetical protein